MIPVEEAKNLIVENSFRLKPIEQKISSALNYILSKDVISPINYPPFDQSAMDGFAIKYSDLSENRKIEIVGEAPAGSPFKGKISSGESLRIFTGAKIPDGADAVVIQENVSVENGNIVIEKNGLHPLSNIREKGSQIKKEEVALPKGTLLNAGAIGFLAGLGITSVKIYPAPKVTIIVTGNELQKPGNTLNDGQVYESNSFALRSALESINVFSSEIIYTEDDLEKTKSVLQSVMENSDMLLVTGGISVGKFDFVGKCFEELEVKNIFYKISQKPGKPMFFGRKNNCLVFGLPGNPASALSCFYEYVIPAVKTSMGFSEIFLKKINLPVCSDYKKKQGLSLFLKGKISDGKAEILPGQESNNIGSFAFADCLVYLPAEKGNVLKGEIIEVHILP